MRRSWLGFQLVLLSCALLLAVVVVEGRHGEEEEDSSKEEGHCEKRHHCMEECCKKRCHHEEEECCCEKRCHHEEDECCEKRCHHEEEECCCEKRCHHEEEECCCEKRCHHEEEECCCEKRCHHEEEECCCEKRCHHEEEECCCEKRHHHKDEECCKKKHSHGKEDTGKKKPSRVVVEEEAADKKKAPHKGKKRSRKGHPFLDESEDATADSSEIYKHFAKEEQERITELAAQTSDAVSHYRKEQAIAHFNQGSEGTYYKHLEDGQLEYKKAIGVMIYVKMLLAETNCTKTKEQEEAGVEYSRAYLEKEGCQLLPQFKQEKHNCTFGIFLDMRTEKKAVVSQDCTIIPGIKQLSRPLKGLSN